MSDNGRKTNLIGNWHSTRRTRERERNRRVNRRHGSMVGDVGDLIVAAAAVTLKKQFPVRSAA